MTPRRYKVVIADSGKEDIKQRKKYIIDNFKYRSYAENFSHKIKKAVMQLDIFPVGYDTTGFTYKEYDIYFKPYQSYIIFYTVNDDKGVVTVLRVLRDSEDWQYIIRKWIFENR